MYWFATISAGLFAFNWYGKLAIALWILSAISRSFWLIFTRSPVCRIVSSSILRSEICRTSISFFCSTRKSKSCSFKKLLTAYFLPRSLISPVSFSNPRRKIAISNSLLGISTFCVIAFSIFARNALWIGALLCQGFSCVALFRNSPSVLLLSSAKAFSATLKNCERVLCLSFSYNSSFLVWSFMIVCSTLFCRDVYKVSPARKRSTVSVSSGVRFCKAISVILNGVSGLLPRARDCPYS